MWNCARKVQRIALLSRCDKRWCADPPQTRAMKPHRNNSDTTFVWIQGDFCLCISGACCPLIVAPCSSLVSGKLVGQSSSSHPRSQTEAVYTDLHMCAPLHTCRSNHKGACHGKGSDSIKFAPSWPATRRDPRSYLLGLLYKTDHTLTASAFIHTLLSLPKPAFSGT